MWSVHRVLLESGIDTEMTELRMGVNVCENMNDHFLKIVISCDLKKTLIRNHSDIIEPIQNSEISENSPPFAPIRSHSGADGC